jgi:hypothetical protein
MAPSSARCVNSPSVRRKLCWRSTSNLLSRPKNSCVSFMPRQASARAAASMALSSRRVALSSRCTNATGPALRPRCTCRSPTGTRRGRWRRARRSCARPRLARLKNCRLSDGSTPGLAAASLTAKPACQRLKNSRRSMASPSAMPMRFAARHLFVDTSLLVHRVSLRVSASTGPHSSSACSSSTQGPRSRVARKRLVMRAGVRGHGRAFGQAHGRGGVLVAHALGAQRGEAVSVVSDLAWLGRSSGFLRCQSLRVASVRSPPRATR